MKDKPIEQNDKNKIKNIVSFLQKQYGDHSVGMAGEMDLVIKRLSTGSPLLDLKLGGGLPLGRTIELYGQPHSGKTLISLRTIRAAQEKNMSCAFIDAEGSFDPKFSEKLGVDNSKLIFIREAEGDKVFTILQELVERGIEVIVIDSIASISPTYELEEDFNKNTIGIHARMMSKALRKLTGAISKNNTLILFLNQIREKVGAYGNPETTTGGRALGFYASVRIEVRARVEKEGKEKTHQMVKWAITKNKAGNPHGYGEFIYHYKNGINYDDELLQFLLEKGEVKKSGSFYQILGKQFHGRKEFYEELKSNPKFKEQLLKL